MLGFAIPSCRLFSFSQVITDGYRPTPGLHMPPSGAANLIPLPPVGSYYHGVFPGGKTSSEDDITIRDLRSYEEHAGKSAAWVYFSHNWYQGRKFPFSTADWIRQTGSVPYIRLMLRSDTEQDHADPLYTLENILKGEFDNSLHDWAVAAREYGSPLIVEYGVEVNGEWFPWNGKWNGAGSTLDFGDPSFSDGAERFREAYRHVISIFRQENAANITWVFHVNDYDIPEEDWNRLEAYYPGDEWIDWLGVSVYGALTPMDTEWSEFQVSMDGVYPRLESLSPVKPVVVSEFAVTAGNPYIDQAEWARRALEDITSDRWERVIGFSWWNERWQNDDESAHDTTMRLQDNPALATVFKGLVGEAPNILGGINAPN